MTEAGAKRYRVGVIGFAHMHINELVQQFVASGRADIVACADTHPLTPSRTTVEGSRRANLQRALRAPGAPRVYEDYEELLRQERPDIVVMCPENARHGEVAGAAARHGAHLVTEKPMAARLDEARGMALAAREANVALAVNWPITWAPAIRKLKAMIEADEIGDIYQLKWRSGASLGPLAHGSAHPGATVVSGMVSDEDKASEWWHQSAAGGGALLDYCCYGACLASWLMPSAPASVQCLTANLANRFGDAEDNAAMLVRYESAMAILEASWTTIHPGVPNGPILYGSRGTIVFDKGAAHVFREKGASAPSRVERGDPLPRGRATIAEEVLHHIETGESLHETLAAPLNLATMAILDAGIESARSGAAESVAKAG